MDRSAVVGLVFVLGLALVVGRPGAHADDGVTESEAQQLTVTDLMVAGVPGFDISWPQCNKQYPPGPVAFAVIGMNNGKPYTTNPCFLDQFRWAQKVEKTPAVYVNTDFPKDGRPEAHVGPYGNCAADDGWCRGYNWGYGLSKEVVERANRLGIAPSTYWLDVETGNYWSGDKQNNSQVLRGAIEYFKEKKLPVGMYGTPYQWGLIAGDWKSPGVPIWTAGAQGLSGAAARCTPSYAFAGGTVVMVQYYDLGYDTNYICPGSQLLFKHPEPYPVVIGPRGRTAQTQGKNLQYWQIIPLVSN